jgi:hypothetical protein
MAYGLAEFRADFPAFSATSDDNVTAALNRARRYISAAVWGAMYEEAMGLKTATLLTASSTGVRARRGGDGESDYDKKLRLLAAGIPRRTLAVYRE